MVMIARLQKNPILILNHSSIVLKNVAKRLKIDYECILDSSRCIQSLNNTVPRSLEVQEARYVCFIVFCYWIASPAD
jgi:hypothetical protein